MRRIFIITALLFLTTLSVHSQTSEKDLDQIRSWFKDINSSIDNFRKEDYQDVNINEYLDTSQYSMEGRTIYRLEKVNMTKYFEGDQLVKVVLIFVGDREELISEYYFKNDNLFFVDKEKTIYHRPKWHDKFNEAERSVAKNRFYLKNNQLIRWIDPELQSVGKISPSYKDHESKLLNDSRLYVRIN